MSLEFFLLQRATVQSKVTCIVSFTDDFIQKKDAAKHRCTWPGVLSVGKGKGENAHVWCSIQKDYMAKHRSIKSRELSIGHFSFVFLKVITSVSFREPSKKNTLNTDKLDQVYFLVKERKQRKGSRQFLSLAEGMAPRYLLDESYILWFCLYCKFSIYVNLYGLQYA